MVPEVDDRLLRITASGDEARYRELAAMGARHVLIVPLLSGGQVVGLLTLAATDAERWSEDGDLELAGDLGQRVVATVAAERVATRQRHLHEVTSALSAAGTVAEAATELASVLRRVLGASVVDVCRLETDGLLHLVHSAGYPPERAARFATVPLATPLPIAAAARTGRPVWLADRQARRDRYPESLPHLLEQTQAAAALPLLVGGRVLGTVTASFPEPRLFEPDERAFLLSLIDQAAAAFERAALADARRTMPHWPTRGAPWPTRSNAACCPAPCHIPTGWRSPPATCRRSQGPRPAATGSTSSSSTAAGSPSPSETSWETARRRLR
nr:GAF domain-containing protein [Geodermatophilus aquaeductus]